ncbi:MAG: carboxypeptidase-like regulatory domain-containing protein [Chitinophagales bacterium]|nr:carboxypeptidase-like regulatory domain-containing protein [Chitinophagales bacterium]MDW8420027.1 carboxypeptidase-like regulatory domain-containing protein [Chitinophagales bacterium]
MRVFVLILFLSISCGLFSQHFSNILSGIVYDKETNQPLWGVNVLLQSGNIIRGTSTNETGEFTFDSVPVGRVSLRLSLTGYQPVQLNDILITTGKQLTLQIEMQEKVNQLSEVEVTARRDKSKAHNDFATTSVRSFSAEEMTRYAGTLNDPARMAQSFAGVMTSNDENNQIVVRGNSPRGLLWRLEGIEIPNPNHFAGSEGATGGGVSMLSANMLTNTDFYSGAFPAEYGNALSSVFDLRFRKGNHERHEITLQAGILGAEAAAEGPFSKRYRGSYLINYRYSTLDLFALTGFKIGGDITPKYQDLNFHFYFPTRQAGSFSIFGLGGISSLGETATDDTAQWKTFQDKLSYEQRQRTGVVGVTYLRPLPDGKSYAKAIMSYSNTRNIFSADTFSFNLIPYNIEMNKFEYQTLRSHLFFNTKLSNRDVVRSGVLTHHLFYHLYSREYSFPDKARFVRVNQRGLTHLVQAYIMWKHRFNDRTTLNSGVHFTFSHINNKLYAEPRMGVEHILNEQLTLTAATGLHSRMDAVSTYISYAPGKSGDFPNRRLDFTRAWHTVIGVNYNFLKHFRCKAELYYQWLFHVPVGADTPYITYSILNYDDGFISFPLRSAGQGTNYGLEVTLEKFFSQQYYFTFTASLFDSRYLATDNRWRNTLYNVNYVMNILGGKEFTVGSRKNNIIGTNTRIIWRGGQRYTPIDLPASIAAGYTVLNNDAAFRNKLPDYFRIDFGINFRRNKKNYSWVLSFDAQNVINRRNPARVVYNPDNQKIETRRSLGIVPVLSWKVYFAIITKNR